MPGVFTQRTPQAKYTFICDVEVVLEKLKKLTESNLLFDRKQPLTLTFKLVLLLALTAASRASEMTDLNLNYLSKSQ